MTVFKEFLKIKRSSVLLFALLMVILCVTAYLYSLTAEAVIYTAVLWAVAVTAVFTAEFLKFRKKSIQLDKIKSNLPAMREYMPEPSDAVEKSYNEIALSLLEEKNRVEAREAAKLKEYMGEAEIAQMKEDMAVQRAVDFLVKEAKLV